MGGAPRNAAGRGRVKVVVCCLIASICLPSIAMGAAAKARNRDWELFQDFQKKFKKTYSTPEEVAKRFGCFRETLQLLEVRNAQLKQSSKILPGAVHAPTTDSDLCEEEYARKNPHAPSLVTLHLKPFSKPAPHTQAKGSAPKKQKRKTKAQARRSR